MMQKGQGWGGWQALICCWWQPALGPHRIHVMWGDNNNSVGVRGGGGGRCPTAFIRFMLGIIRGDNI